MFKTLRDIDIHNKTVLVRTDFNVPLNPQGKIIDETRLKATLPTLRYLLENRCKVVLLSHLGRPEKIDPSLSLNILVERLSSLTGQPVHFTKTLDEARSLIQTLPLGSLILLENLRFNKAEEQPELDPTFAKHLSELGQVYINEAFACSHRAHSSITGLPCYFPKAKAAGFLLAHEIEALKKVLTPKHPFYLLLGGSKIATKMGVIQALLPKAEALFIGGAMAIPFMQASSIPIGANPCDPKQLEMASSIIHSAERLNKKLYLPEDWKCKQDIRSPDPYKIFTKEEGIAPGYLAFDIGPSTIQTWKGHLKDAKTLFWNGPFGMYEVPPFDEGTAQIAQAIASITCDSIVGGGDSVAAIEKQNLTQAFTHLSTGGGASLEFIEQGTLPGIEALK